VTKNSVRNNDYTDTRVMVVLSDWPLSALWDSGGEEEVEEESGGGRIGLSLPMVGSCKMVSFGSTALFFGTEVEDGATWSKT
jgi:hypothetical protein